MCPSVLRPNLASKKKRWQAPTIYKNIHIHFWSKPWLITSWCPDSLPIVLPCWMAAFWRLHFSGWTRIDSAQCSLMAFRSTAHLGPVATSTPVRILLRSPPIAAWIAPLNFIEDLDGHTADEDNFGSLRCSQGALESHANFLGTSQPYILYLWEYLDAHDLLRTSFQWLDEKVAARNGGKGVPSIIQSGKAKPSDNASTLGTNKTQNSPASGFDDDKIGNGIQSLGESNIRAACIKSNAAEKNTLPNLLYYSTYKHRRGRW